MKQLFARLDGRPATTAGERSTGASAGTVGGAWLAGALLLLCPIAPARDLVASDIQVKAAYLHKLPGFVEWPAGSFATPGSALLIGIADAEAVYEELRRQAAGRSIQGRPIEIRRVDAAPPLPAVHVIFIGGRGRQDVELLLSQAAGRPVLTVTSLQAGLASGAVLNLVELEGRIRVEASLPAAARQGLKLSSRLLGVASRVVEDPP